jgi:hypothetical protein
MKTMGLQLVDLFLMILLYLGSEESIFKMEVSSKVGIYIHKVR